MSENEQSSTRAGEWLTVSQAAAMLGISERQARRDAKRLKADDRRDAGHMAGALVSQLQSENAFLRAQTEAANRQAAEATAALREYLKMQAKALPEPTSSTRNDGETSRDVGTETPQNAATGKVSQGAKSAAQNNARREMRPLWKVILGVR